MDAIDLEKFNDAVALAQAGKKQEAYQRLKALTLRNLKDSNLWLWLAFTSPYAQESQKAIRQAISIDPANPNLQAAKEWFDKERRKDLPIENNTTAKSPPPPEFKSAVFNSNTYSYQAAPQQSPSSSRTSNSTPRNNQQPRFERNGPYRISSTKKSGEPIPFLRFLGYLVICCSIVILIFYGGEKIVGLLKEEGVRVIQNAPENIYTIQREADRYIQLIEQIRAGEFAVLIICIGACAFWCKEDSKKRIEGSGFIIIGKPYEVLFIVLFLWPLFFPIYLTQRDIYNFKTGRQISS